MRRELGWILAGWALYAAWLWFLVSGLAQHSSPKIADTWWTPLDLQPFWEEQAQHFAYPVGGYRGGCVFWHHHGVLYSDNGILQPRREDAD